MKKSLTDLQAQKDAGQPIVCLTCYTAPMAEILDPHCDLLLVGDSMGMTLYGMENTLGVTLDMIIAHGCAVRRGAEKAVIMVDMPYDTYESSPRQAYDNAKRIMDETGCDCVKLEGGMEMVETVRMLTQNGIPVMAHIGLQPQSVVKEGGYKIKGKTEEDAQRLMEEAKAHEEAGAFALLLEGTIEDVASDITRAVSIPTIGIGAGRGCNGQILVSEDLLGMLSMSPPKFAKQYAQLRDTISEFAAQYATEVREQKFPSEEHIYTAPRQDQLKKAS